MHTLRSVVVAVGLAAGLGAQGVNCGLLGTFNNHGPFNDVWGYVAPNGDEYALLCTTTGTVVVDVTNPANPIERGWFPWAASGWRDARTYGNYAYIVTESALGFQVLDLSNPNNPTVVGQLGTANSNNAHNVCVDVGAGRLYLVGCNTGTPVYDLTSSASNPTFLGYALPGGNSNYFHDLCVENGYAYGAMIYNGVLRITDSGSAFPWGALSNSSTPLTATHHAWPNAAGTVCVTTDERTGGVAKFWDVTNKSSPQSLSTFTPNPSAVPHNAFIVGDRCHASWYTEGYRCIDISNPGNPVEVASYDTWPGASGGFNGCWGVYPFLPSGNILVSDRSTGLYIVRPTQASFETYGQGCPGSVPALTPCASSNTAGGSFASTALTFETSYRVSNPGTVQVAEFELFTQSSQGTITRPAHIYPISGGLPAATPLASTTITVGGTSGFYRATFNPPVTVTGDFSIGYETSPGGAPSNVTLGTLGTGYHRLAVVGNWQQSGNVRPSYRVVCSVGLFQVPRLSGLGAPIPGFSYDVTLADAVASSASFLVTGFSDAMFNGSPLPAAIPGAPGCDIYAEPLVTQLTFTNGMGESSATFSVPNSGAYVGLEMFHQWAVLDPTVNSIGIVVSDAGKATIDF